MKLPIAALTALALAACNNAQAPGGNGAARSDAAAGGGVIASGQPAGGQEAATMRPGLWETTTRVVSVEAPTAPPEVQEQLRATQAMAPVTERSCLTPAEAADQAEAIRARTTNTTPGFICQTGESLFAGGRIRMTLTCRSSTGQPDQRQAMVGSFTGESMQVAVSAESATPATELVASIPVRVESTMTGRRLGDCPPGGTAN